MNFEILKKYIFFSKQGLVYLILFLLLFLLSCFMVLNNGSQKKEILPELRLITDSIRNHYQKKPTYAGLNTLTVLEEKIVPAYMIRNNKIFSRLKNEILVGRDEIGSTSIASDTDFSLIYLNMNQNKCVNAVTEAFGISLGLKSIQILNQNRYEFSYGTDLNLPIKKQDALKYCQAKNTIVFTFE